MTVDELISSWTDEEKEDLKDLIDECRERERIIKKARIESMKGLGRIMDDWIGELAWKLLEEMGDQTRGKA